MRHFGDHDGKSKTSSAVDAEHYPDVNADGQLLENHDKLSHSEIAALAHEIWERSGRPANSHEQDWLDAERQLKEAKGSQTNERTMAAQAGSVQR